MADEVKVMLIIQNGLVKKKNLLSLVFGLYCLSPDCRFDDGDDCVMPLMSASTIWPKLQDAVADGNVFKNITILLFVQVSPLCAVFSFLMHSTDGE